MTAFCYFNILEVASEICYNNNINKLNRDYKTNYKSFKDIKFPGSAPSEGFSLLYYTEFIERVVPIASVRLNTPEIIYKIKPPYLQYEWYELQKHKLSIRKEFVIRNYREAVEYLILHGRAFINTAILCVVMLLATLIVNPLCAYALSRYNLPTTYQILLFLLATMAFPAEVTMIPAFLLIKDLGLLNTYWALILPAMANGFSIFLLKGFFDSLPKELYESAHIDGANEIKMFWHITLALSKPVLAVISLTTFTAAYGMFMFALLICQDKKMWTLMVWLYQMSGWAPMFVMFAGLVLAAIPTLLVFIFCQNIIMRGVILPVEN